MEIGERPEIENLLFSVLLTFKEDEGREALWSELPPSVLRTMD